MPDELTHPKGRIRQRLETSNRKPPVCCCRRQTVWQANHGSYRGTLPSCFGIKNLFNFSFHHRIKVELGPKELQPNASKVSQSQQKPVGPRHSDSDKSMPESKEGTHRQPRPVYRLDPRQTCTHTQFRRSRPDSTGQQLKDKMIIEPDSVPS